MVLIFPHCWKCGFVIGGAYGTGRYLVTVATLVVRVWPHHNSPWRSGGIVALNGLCWVWWDDLYELPQSRDQISWLPNHKILCVLKELSDLNWVDGADKWPSGGEAGAIADCLVVGWDLATPLSRTGGILSALLTCLSQIPKGQRPKVFAISRILYLTFLPIKWCWGDR